MSDTGDRLDVWTGGEAMGLLLAGGARTLRRADGFVRGVAGSESNVAVGLARLGHRVAFGGRVGADPVGGWVRDTLRAEGVGLDGLITDPALPTGILLRDSPLAGPVSVSYYRSGSAGAAVDAGDVHADTISGARAVFLSGITPDVCRLCGRGAVHRSRAWHRGRRRRCRCSSTRTSGCGWPAWPAGEPRFAAASTGSTPCWWGATN